MIKLFIGEKFLYCHFQVAIIYLLACASFLTTYHFVPWPSFFSDILAFSAFAVGAFWCLSQGSAFLWRFSVVFFALFVMSIIPLVQYFMGMIVFFGDSLLAFFFLFGAAIAYSLGFSLSGKSKKSAINWLAWLFFIVGLLSAVAGIIQWFNLSHLFTPYVTKISFSVNPRVTGNLNQANNYATLVVLGLFSTLYLHYKSQLSKAAVILGLIVMSVGCAMAQSKTSWISVAFLCACGIFFQRKYKLDIKSYWLLFLLGGFALCVIVAPWLAGQIHGGSGSVVDRVAGESLRVGIWLGLIQAVMEKPLWGYGWQQVSNAQLAVVDHTAPMIYVEHSHNLLLDLLLWNGCLIGVVIILFFGYRLLRLFIECKTEESWFLLAIISPILIHSMLEFPLNYAYFLLPFAFAFGLSSQKTGTAMVVPVPQGALSIFGVVIMVILGRSVYEYKLYEYKIAKDQSAARGVDVSHIKAPLPQYTLLSQMSGLVNFVNLDVKSKMPSGELEWVGGVAHRYASVASLYRYILILAVNDRPNEAALELKKIKNLHGVDRHVQVCQFLHRAEAELPALSGIPFDCPADK